MVIKRGLFVFLIFVFISQGVLSDEVGTELEIPIIDPIYFDPDIPDQLWASNTNHTNAINLHDHFTNNLGTEMNFSHSFVENILVEIGEEGFVSFFPQEDFEGVRTIIFNVTDGVYSAESNIVTLEVVLDEEPPKWSNPLTDLDPIFQNDFVNFLTTWTDNVALSGFIFSINQGTGWINGSTTKFSGVLNVSEQFVQISASHGTEVQWRFYAWDTSGNINKTDIQTFEVQREEIDVDDPERDPVPEIIDPEEPFPDFSVTPRRIDVELKQGEETVRFLRIQNERREEMFFDIVLSGLEEFISLERSEIRVGPRSSETIPINFKIGERAFPDIYFSSIEITSGGRMQRIPIVLEINPLELDFEISVEIKNENKRVLPGEIVQAEIQVLNLRDLPRENGTIYYAIKDLNGRTLDFFEDILVLQDEIIIFANLTIPPEAEKGYYVFYARGVIENSVSIGKDDFEVGERFDVAGFLRMNSIFIVIITIVLLTILLIIRNHRNKERLKILKLYLKVNELKELIDQKQIDKAVDYYIKLKSEYGEPFSGKYSLDERQIKEEMLKLVKFLEASSKKKKESEEDEDKKNTEEDEETSEKEEIEESNTDQQIEENTEKEEDTQGSEKNIDSTKKKTSTKKKVKK